MTGVIRFCVGLMVVHFAVAGSAPRSDSLEIQAAMDGNAQFAFALYREISSRVSGNVFISPWSVSCTLAAAQAGAGGATAAEISKAAFLPPSRQVLERGFVFLRQRLGELDEQEGIDLRCVMGILAHPAQELRSDFVDFCTAALGARVIGAPFNADVINRWVGQETMGRIERVIGPSDLHELSRLLLVNAVYFKAPWQRQFSVESTRSGPFRLVSGITVEVPMMHGEHRALHGTYGQARVLQLPYSSDGVVMMLFLPTEDTPLTAIERSLSIDWLRGSYRSLTPEAVNVTLPRFSIRSSLNLNSTLRGLGVSKAFTLEADFSGIDGDCENLLIDSVLHHTYVQVNEQGTEAAVATASHMMTRSAREPVEFVFDRPFLFVIQAVRAGTILFIGRVSDPSIQAPTSAGF